MSDVRCVSIVIRTLNEANFIAQLLSSIQEQEKPSSVNLECIIVDSESCDATVPLAKKYGAKVVTIKRSSFSFGRALNIGISHSKGDIIIAISGHCIPYDRFWLMNLIQPILNGQTGMSFGRQVRTHKSRFSEGVFFNLVFPKQVEHPNEKWFLNNANSAFERRLWEEFGFDEYLSGLEDIEFGLKVFLKYGMHSVYCPYATVFHNHEEANRNVFKRFYREEIARRKFSSERLSFWTCVKLLFSSLYNDLKLINERPIVKIRSIFGYRLAQHIAIILAHRK